MSDILPFRIFAVDPATGKSGWALLEVLSLSPLKIKIVDHGTLDGQKLLRLRKDLSKTFIKQYCVLDALYDEYTKLLEDFKPDHVVSEGAFGYTHLNALISLTLAINTLRRASHTVLHKDLVEIPPTISKKSFTGHGGADKDRMRLAYNTIDLLIRKDSNKEISEHEIDAIAHGCAFVKVHITQEITQISAADKKRDKTARQLAKEEKKLISV